MLVGSLRSIVDLSLVIGGIILCLLLVRPFVYRKMAVKWWCGIWFVLLLRLLVPFSGEVQLNIVEWGKSLISSNDLKQSVSVGTRQGMKNQLSSAVLGSDESGFSNNLIEINAKVKDQNNTDDLLGAGTDGVDERALNNYSYLLGYGNSKGVIGGIWLMGCLIFMGYEWIIYRNFRKQCMRWGHPIKDEMLTKIFDEICKELHIRRYIKVEMCKKVDSPLIIGYLHPSILLPHRAYEEAELYYIFKHELIHYKYGHLWYKLLLLGARAVHWFNPLIHMMAKVAAEDLEGVCDYRVLRGESAQSQRAYMQIILKVAEYSHQRSMALSTQFRGNKQVLQKRFANIVNHPKRHRGMVLFIMVMCVGAGSSCVGITRGQKQVTDEVKVESLKEGELVANELSVTKSVLGGDTQVLGLNGYDISVPSQWNIKNEKNPFTELFYKRGQKIGGVRLINKNLKVEELLRVFELPVDDIEIEKKDVASYNIKLMKTSCKVLGKDTYVQYIFYNLPNPQPYGYAMYFDLREVSQEEIDQILASFTVPDLGENLEILPDKNRDKLVIDDCVRYVVDLNKGTKEVFNLEKLNDFIEHQANGVSDTLHVISYTKTGDGIVLNDWYNIVFDGKVGRCFSYYQAEDGTYTYDNIPIVFSKIQRKYYEKEGIISYRLVGDDGNEEGTMRFLEVPVPKAESGFYAPLQ